MNFPRSVLVLLVVLIVAGGLLTLALLTDLVAPPEESEPSRSVPESEPAGGDTGEPGGASRPDTPARSHASIRHLARGAGTISGRVWRGDRPGSAEVSLLRAGSNRSPAAVPPAALAEIDTGASGSFRFSGLEAGDYILLARGRDGALARATPHLWRDAHAHFDLRLTDPISLRGRARYADGRPFAGRAILGEARADTDAEGRFQLDGLVPGSGDLLLVAPGGIRVGRRVTVPHEGELLVVVDADLQPVRGRVVAHDDGRPVAGARVRATGSLYREETTTDAAGTFLLSLPEHGRLAVAAEGFAPLRDVRWTGKPSIVLRLERGARIEGRILAREDGSPRPGIGVFFDPSKFFGPERDAPDAVSGEDGTFAIEDLPRGRLTILARGDGWIDERLLGEVAFRINPLAVKTSLGQATTTDLYVVRTGRFEGRVTRPNGEGVAGASVEARPKTGRMRNLAPRSITGADGSFALEDVTPGRGYEIRVVSPDGLRSSPGRAVSVESGATERVDVTLPEPRWIHLVVTDADTGAPVVGARIEAYQDLRTRPYRTGDDGRARLGPFEPGKLRFRVEHDEYLCPAAWQGVAADGPSAVALRPRRGLPLGGRVEFPPDLVGIQAHAVVWRAPRLDAFRVKRGMRIDAEGRFLIGPFPPGSYEIVVNVVKPQAYSSPPTICVAGSLDHVLVVPPPPLPEAEKAPRTMLIRWIGPDGKKPRGGIVTVIDAVTGRRLDLGHIGAGQDAYPWEIPDGVESVLLEVHGARSADGSPLGMVLHGPIPAKEGEVAVHVPVGKTISGRIVDEAGAGLPGLRVGVRPTRREDRHSSAAATTDAEGRFSIPGLSDEDHVLVVSSPRDRGSAGERVVPAGRTGLRIVLPKAITLTVLVRDPDGRPVDDVQAVAVALRNRTARLCAITTAEGRAELPRIVPGAAYDLRFTAYRRDTPNLALLVPGVVIGPKTMTVRLRQGLTIRGRVLGAKRAMVRAMLEWSQVDADVADDGTFELRGLTAETWTVTVHERGSWKSWPAQQVRAGETVEFDIREK